MRRNKISKKLHTRLSYSQINNFETCPRRWKYEYHDKIIDKQESIHLSYGSAVHHVLENLLKERANYNDLELGSNESEIIRNGLEHVKSEIEPFSGKVDTNYLLELARADFDRFKLNKGFYSFLNDDVNILGVEEKFTLDIPVKYAGKKETISVLGYIDLIYEDKDGIVVVDHKTSKKKFQKAKRRNDLQLPIYFMAIRQKFGIYPYKGTYNFTKLDLTQDTLFTNKVTQDMNDLMDKRNPKKIYGVDPDNAEKKIIQTFKDMNDPKKRNIAKSTPLCYWCNAKDICKDASNWKPKEK